MKITARRDEGRDWEIRIDRDWYVHNPSLTHLAIYGLIHIAFIENIRVSLRKVIE